MPETVEFERWELEFLSDAFPPDAIDQDARRLQIKIIAARDAARMKDVAKANPKAVK
jgi:hypothetical protein